MRSKMSAIGTSDSVFHDGNPSTGELGTIVTADWLNAVQASTMDLQDELLNVLAAASIANDSAVKTQILAAIKYLSNLATFATDTGTANTYVATLAPALTAYADGVKIRLKILNANTGTSTLNVNALGAKTIYGGAHAVLQGGELVANGYAELEYSASLGGFVLLFCTGAPEQLAPAVKSLHALTLGQFLGGATSSSYIKIPFIDIADGVTKRNLIIQWGYTTVIPTGSVGATTTFPIAFPTICAQVVTNYGNATTPAVSYPSNLISQSTTGFTITQQSTGNQQFTYIAIGF